LQWVTMATPTARAMRTISNRSNGRWGVGGRFCFARQARVRAKYFNSFVLRIIIITATVKSSLRGGRRCCINTSRSLLCNPFGCGLANRSSVATQRQRNGGSVRGRQRTTNNAQRTTRNEQRTTNNAQRTTRKRHTAHRNVLLLQPGAFDLHRAGTADGLDVQRANLAMGSFGSQSTAAFVRSAVCAAAGGWRLPLVLFLKPQSYYYNY
jgi:hypothetical protein